MPDRANSARAFAAFLSERRDYRKVKAPALAIYAEIFVSQPGKDSAATRAMDLQSDLTCPACGHTERLTMPTNACVFFHQCTSCHARLRPKSGDCCVFCSFGSVPCPPIQAGHVDCCAPLKSAGVEQAPSHREAP